MKWNQLFSHNTRRQEGTADSLLRLLAPSLLGMAVCVLTLCSLTWAWFNMAVGSSITGIQSSEVEVCLVTKTTDQTTSTTTWAATTPLVANDDAKETTPDSEKKIYFIARGTAANAYLAVVYNDTTTYYGPLNLTQEPDTNGYYPVYSITLNDASPVNVSLHWGTLPESITPSETQATTVSVPWGGTSTQAQEEASNTPPRRVCSSAPARNARQWRYRRQQQRRQQGARRHRRQHLRHRRDRYYRRWQHFWQHRYWQRS